MGRRSREIDVVRPRRARRVAVTLLVSFLLAVVPIVGLYLGDVPLGEAGKFVYRYSPVVPARLASAVAVMPAAALAVVAAVALCDGRAATRRAGWGLAVLALAALGAWNFWAPPQFLGQHYFNFRSPSHDGAFVNEAERIGSVARYLQHFDQHIQGSIENFGGTRVISNPPLTTVLFRVVLWAWPANVIQPGIVERWYISAYNLPPEIAAQQAVALKAAITCAAMLFLAGVAAMAWGRMFLSPAGAFVFATVVTFNPMTVHFNPGKDPAQLLTVNLMLWAWFAGYRRQSWTLHAIAGGLLAVGMGVGLIHLWVGIAALVATAWDWYCRMKESNIGNWRSAIGNHLLPTVAGGLIVCLAFWLAFDWNLAGTVVAVARRWQRVQPEIAYSRGLWLLIGLPSVLVFVGPAIWLLAGSALRWRWRPTTLGGRLAVATLAVMAVVYFIGIPYELPRLWVVFLPPLVLGLMAIQPLARGRTSRRAAWVMGLVLALHVAGTTVHWSMLDARESEYRLKSRRLFN